MSFGYALGDFVLLTQLAWDVVQNSRKACGAHDELTTEVASLHIVLRRLELEVSKPNSILTRSEDSLDRREELAQLSSDCKRVLRVLDGILEKYNALSEEKRSVTKLWKRVQFGNGEMLDLAELRVKITTSTSALTLFLNLLSIASQGKVESYMESQGDELREMRRSLNWITASMQAKSPKAGEGSILTTYAGDDKAIWKDFRRELIKEGFSSEVLQMHKETIKDYVMELGDRGALDDVEDDFGAGGLPLEGTGGMARRNELEDRNEEEVEKEEEKEVENSEPGPQEAAVADAVESSDETSEDGSGKTPEQCSGPKPEQQSDRIPAEEITNDNGKPGLQRNTKTSDPGAAFETNGDGVRVNNKEPLLCGNQHNLEDSSNPQAQSVDGDAPVTSKRINAAVESQTDHDSEPIFFGVENLDKSKIEGAVGNAKTVARESSGTSLQPSVSAADISKVPQFHYDSDFYFMGDTETLVGVKHWSLGPYKYFRSWSRAWYSLSVIIEPSLFYSESVPSARSSRIYNPHSLCYEILCLARWYDQAQATIKPSSSPTHIFSIADEFQRLVAHASTYYVRVRRAFERVRFPKRLQFLSFYRKMLRDFYCWVREGIQHSQAYESEENQSATLNSMWMLDKSLYLQQRNIEWIWHTTSAVEKLKARSLHELGTRAALDFVYRLFEDERVRSRLTHLITNVQSLLLFFKRWCEDDLLEQECAQYHNKHHYILRHHPIPEYEMRDSGVANAAYEVKMCKVALETWAFQNDFSKERVTTKRFARSENSLSAILERFDESQQKLYQARNALDPVIVGSGVPLDKARSGKREGKKKK